MPATGLLPWWSKKITAFYSECFIEFILLLSLPFLKRGKNIYTHQKKNTYLPTRSSILTACWTRMGQVNDIAPFDYVTLVPVMGVFQTSNNNEYINISHGRNHSGLNKRDRRRINIYLLGALSAFLKSWMVGQRTVCRGEYALGLLRESRIWWEDLSAGNQKYQVYFR